MGGVTGGGTAGSAEQMAPHSLVMAPMGMLSGLMGGKGGDEGSGVPQMAGVQRPSVPPITAAMPSAMKRMPPVDTTTPQVGNTQLVDVLRKLQGGVG